MVVDVICGMEIDEKTAKWKTKYKDKTYYFCGPICKLEFDENPEKRAPTLFDELFFQCSVDDTSDHRKTWCRKLGL